MAEFEERQPRRKGSRLNRVEPLWSRRQLLRETGITVGIAAGLGGLGWLAYSRDPLRRGREEILTLADFRVTESTLYPRLVVVRGQVAEAMVREAVATLGGIGRFINRGDKVLIKPNVGWDRQPEQGANTGPEVVAAVATLCREAGAGQVWVTDCSLNDPQRCFSRSGIEVAANGVGAQVLLPGSDDYRLTDMGGKLLKVWPVARYYHQADKLINLPIVKHHSLSGCTVAMKNWYGVLGGQRNRLHQDIHGSIVDLAGAVRPTLTIVDAIRVLKRNGPTGGSLDDVARENTILAGLDEVALDAYAVGFLGLVPGQVPYLAMAEKRGLGRVNWRELNWIERQSG